MEMFIVKKQVKDYALRGLSKELRKKKKDWKKIREITKGLPVVTMVIQKIKKKKRKNLEDLDQNHLVVHHYHLI